MCEEMKIMEQVKAGDEAARECIYKKYNNSLLVFCKRFIMGTSPVPDFDAENLAQDTWVKFYEELAKFDLSRSVKSWLYKIAQNNCLNFIKKYRVAVGDEEVKVKFSSLDTVTGKVVIYDDETGEIGEIQL